MLFLNPQLKTAARLIFMGSGIAGCVLLLATWRIGLGTRTTVPASECEHYAAARVTQACLS